MTIALGLISTGGIVLAADTQDGIPGWMKTSQTKIDVGWWGDDRRSACVVCGAGTSGYIDSLAQQLHAAFRSAKPEPSDYQAVIETTLGAFYKDHVIPFLAQPDPPTVRLLVAVQHHGISTLFATEQTAIRECRDRDNYVAIGAGEQAARSVLGHYYFWESDLQTAEVLAALSVYRVKELVDGCGGHTEVCRLHAEGVEFVNPKYIAKLEELFSEQVKLERANFHFAIAGLPGHYEWMGEQLEMLRSKFQELQKVRDEWWLPPQGPFDAAIR